MLQTRAIVASGHSLSFYILAAVLPALILLIYIYRKDRVEKEPPALIGKLALLGAISGFAAVWLESMLESFLDHLIAPEGYLRVSSNLYVILFTFLVVALAEEGVKLLFLYLGSWKNPNFSHLFDGIVYAASVSLGFAALENIFYVMTYGTEVIVTRALFAIPAHLGFSVFMGVYYGKAKEYENAGLLNKKRSALCGSFLVPVFLHGLYDACAMMDSAIATLFFYVFVAAMDFWVFKKILPRQAEQDRPIR